MTHEYSHLTLSVKENKKNNFSDFAIANANAQKNEKFDKNVIFSKRNIYKVLFLYGIIFVAVSFCVERFKAENFLLLDEEGNGLTGWGRISGNVGKGRDLADARDIGFKILDWLLILVLVSLSALFSGLTLGLMSLDVIGLEIVIGGDPESDDARYAKQILPIRKNGNLLLCTLLLGNTCANSTLSVILASYTSGAIGIVLSTGMIVVLGEILPQALCSRHALYVGSHTVFLVKIFMVLLYPVAKPISLGLSLLFADEIGSLYSSSELTKLLEIHAKNKLIDFDQAKIMSGAIDFRDKNVGSIMTPKEKIFMLSTDDVLDFQMITKIFQSGYSRIPVYHDNDTNNIIGLILVKDLIVIDPEDSISVQSVISFFGRPVMWVWKDAKLSELLALFKSGKGHMALVREVNSESDVKDPFYELLGLVTLEDIIEEIIKDEIIDETDLYVHVENFNSKVNRSSFDIERLKLLDSEHPSTLSEDEIKAIVAHFKTNVPAFANLTAEQIEAIVKTGKVLEFTKGQVIYKKNEPVSFITLVLSGKLRVTSGKESFISEHGPWSVLGSQALLFESDLSKDNMDLSKQFDKYVGDFGAVVLSERLRCVRIIKKEYVRILRGGDKRSYSAMNLPVSGNSEGNNTNVGANVLNLHVIEEQANEEKPKRSNSAEIV